MDRRLLLLPFRNPRQSLELLMTWAATYDDAVKEAQAAKKPLLVDAFSPN